MWNTKRAQRVLLMTVIFLSGSHRGMASSNPQLQVASELARQFETVFYVKAAFLETPNAYKELSPRTANSLRVPFSDLLGGFQSLGNQVPTQVFSAADAVFVGAKDFRPPHGLGAVQSQFCFVVALSKESQFDIGSLAKTSSLISSVGDGVWTWETKPTEGQTKPQKYFALQSAHIYLLVSNDLTTLRAIAGELGSKNRKVLQLPKEMPDWQSLSQNDLWGYRRYRHGEVVDRNAAGTNDVTSTATALLFSVDASKKNAVMRLVASDGTTAERMNVAGKLPQLKPVGASVWETNIPLADNEETVEQILAAMWLFGFGIYL